MCTEWCSDTKRTLRVVCRARSTTRCASISGAERDEVARDVAGAADHHFAALAGDHRRRRLRRDARHLAVDELVEHQVAHHEHRLAGEVREMPVEIEHQRYRSC
jgi:hypothetical protein